jgi:hypothetical protein
MGDLAGIWNFVATSSGSINGTPPDWVAAMYWAASPFGSQYYSLELRNGNAAPLAQNNSSFVALQVL